MAENLRGPKIKGSKVYELGIVFILDLFFEVYPIFCYWNIFFNTQYIFLTTTIEYKRSKGKPRAAIFKIAAPGYPLERLYSNIILLVVVKKTPEKSSFYVWIIKKDTLQQYKSQLNK